MVDLLEARRRILLNTPHLESLSGATASFETDMASKLKECKIHFTPIQEGSGDPSPDNVRPIHGWDGVTVTRCGKNLLNPNDPDFGQYTVSPTGEQTIGNDRITTGFISCEENVAVTASGIRKYSNNKVFNFAAISAWDKDKTYISRVNVNGSNSITLITPPDTKYIRFSEQIGDRKNVTPSIFEEYGRQLELGSEATDYEPYTETSITIPFPQTIYGGYVDLVKGEVVEECIDYDMGDLDWGADTTEHLFAHTFSVMPVNENNALKTTYCEGYHPTYNSSLGTIRRIIGNYAIMGRSLYKSLWFRDDRYSTGAEFKQGNAGNHIIVPLATPITYPLDPVTIRTLRGMNNIFSSANGNIEIKYWTH